MDDLNDDNWQLYAARVYEKPAAITSEFEEDLARLLYIKRLLTKYYSSGVLNDRLILNHIIVLYNVFGIPAATRLLFLKMEKKDLIVIKPFLVFLDLLPEQVEAIRGVTIDTASIGMDKNAITALKGLR